MSKNQPNEPELTKIQKKALKDTGSPSCTRCGRKLVVSKPAYEFYRQYMKVRIQLCIDCIPVVINDYLDLCVDGTDRDMAIDRLSKFYQK